MCRFSSFFCGHRDDDDDDKHNKNPKPPAQDKGKGKAPAQPTAPSQPTSPSHPAAPAPDDEARALPQAPSQPALLPATAALLSHFNETHRALEEQNNRLTALRRLRVAAAARRRHIVETLRAPPYRPPPPAYREAYLELVQKVRALFLAAEAAEFALAQRLPVVIVQLEAYLDATHGLWNPDRYEIDRWGSIRSMFVWEMEEGGLGPAAAPRLAAETHSCGPEYEVLELSKGLDYDVVKDTKGKAVLS